MNPLNPIFVIVIYFIAFITAYLLNQKYRIKNDNVRYETIDGFRGLLALGVFIHHSSIWYQFLKTSVWEGPKSILYFELGKTSVTFFFMITSFLFITKLLNTKDRKFDWNAFFISRVFRLFPMYIISIMTLVIIVLIISEWELKVSLIRFIKELFCWVAFTFPGARSINQYSYTSIINAGIVWSLVYEWTFYFSLPLISLLILKKKPSILFLIISLLFIIAFIKYKNPDLYLITSFIGGMISPILIKYGSKKINYNSIFFSVTILICVVLTFFFHIKYFNTISAIIIFNLIALGNNIFGLLKSSTLKLLGEISYSTYLIHGILIFITMYFYYGIENAASLTVIEFWLSIFVITPILVLTSFISYIYIEKPCMDYYKKTILKR